MPLDEKKTALAVIVECFFYDSYGAPGLRTVIKIGYGSWGFADFSIGKSGIRYIFHLRKMK